MSSTLLTGDLRGRDADLAAVARLIADARTGRSGVLVLRGEAGIGKTALLDAAARRAADDHRVLRATGAEAEATLPFAALHMLLRPVLARLEMLPDAQATALRAALGLTDASDVDRFLVGLAVLTLLSELAAERPLVCLVDDAHWLDPASAETLLFAARRVEAEGIAMVFAARDGFDARGLPELTVGRLDEDSAADLLGEHAPDLAAPVRDRILQEAAGNPLALLELPDGLTAEQRSGAVPVPPAALPASRRVLEVFGARIDRLPERTRLALTVAAAEGTGDLATVLQAAGALGASASDLEPAEHAGLVRLTGTGLAFRHPLTRSAAYQNAALTTRLAVHRALADVLDGDRRALHRAAATAAPDEHVAAELERAAYGAGARGALAAAVPLFEQAARLSPARSDHARRLMRAAQTAITSGRTEQAADLAERATALTGDPGVQGGLAMVRATVDVERGTPRGAAELLADSAEPLLRADPDLALTLLVMGAGNAWAAGEDGTIRRVAALASAFDTARPHPIAASIAALGHLVNEDRAAGAHKGLPVLRRLVDRARSVPPGGLITRIHVTNAALLLGDDEAATELASAAVARSRRRGMAGGLPVTLQMLAQAQTAAGRHRDAATAIDEALRLARDTGQSHRIGRINAVAARLAAVEGDEERCRDLAGGVDGGLAEPAAAAECALALLDLAFGRYEDATRRLEEAVRGPARHTVVFANADLIEATVRAGRPERAAGAAELLDAWAQGTRLPWVAAVASRCRALLDPTDQAAEHYERAIRLHMEGGRPFERARTELLYGEWLRRARRRSRAREPLRSALAIFERLGAAPWAEHARAELRATGENVGRAPGTDALSRLTPQELQIVRLAAAGVSNRDIAAQLFLSHRTVEYHLYKAYPKLGVGSRAELASLVRSHPRPGNDSP